MLRGDIRPMAKWLRMQDDITALLLAEAIEDRTLIYKIPHKQKTYVNWMLCGKYVVEQLQAGVKPQVVLESAEKLFGLSERNIDRAKARWLKHGQYEILAIRYLSGPFANPPLPPNLEINGGDT